MFFPKKITCESSIVILALLQTLCATYLTGIQNVSAINSFAFFLCGVGISICLLLTPRLQITVASVLNRQLLFKILPLLALLPVSYHFARQILDNTPLQIEYADMLPIIGVMCHRFLDGHFLQVYQPIPQIWGGIQPIYLPAMWLPFSFSFLFHFDMRWITVISIWLSIIICILPLWKKSWTLLFYAASLIILLIWFHFNKENNVIRLTEEGVVFFYYSLMALAIILYNPWLIGIAAALCLLSRYAIIGWLPFAAIFLLMTKQSLFLIKSLISGIIITSLLIIPFG